MRLTTLGRVEERPHRAGGFTLPCIAALAMLGIAGKVLAAEPEPPEREVSQADFNRLLNEVDRMREQLGEMEALQERVRVLELELEDARSGGEFPGEREVSESATAKRDITAANQETDAESAPAPDADEGIAFKGALRFNAFWSDSDEATKGTRGDSGLDLFRIGAEGEIDDLLVSAEYRFYPFMDAIHHGWIGYQFDADDQVQLGITRVPFGLLPYAAHSFWFGVPYYMGFSDDYDLGVKYVRQDGPLDLQLAFFKNSELTGATDLGRYSYDVVSVGQSRNEETNQINARAAYTFGRDTACSHELGVSGQWGELYNFDTRRRGDHWAAAGHLDTRCGRWNLQLEAARYEFDPEQPEALDSGTIRMGGFETSYDVASEGTFAVANIAYNLPINSGFIDQVICYNDYSVLFKDRADFRKSQLNTTGCLVGKGPVFVYLDLIQAKNMVFFNNGSLAGGGDGDWRTRFNVNIGYYW
jgi:hypothetical protein